MSWDEGKDAAALKVFGLVDAVLDFNTLKTAATSTHIRGAIPALLRNGRVSLMGATPNIWVREVLSNSITLKGRWPGTVRRMILQPMVS